MVVASIWLLFKRLELFVFLASVALEQELHVGSAQQIHEDVAERLLERQQAHIDPGRVAVYACLDCHLL